MYDLLFYNVRIIEGSNKPSFIGSLAVADGKIAAIGNIEAGARRVIDGAGLCLAPGFIDAHSHGDQALAQDANAKSKLCQGITTEIAGVCGLTLFPSQSQQALDLIVNALEITEAPKLQDVKSFAAYRNYANSKGVRINTASFIGHGTIRLNSMLNPSNPIPSQSELETMKAQVRKAMEEGCLGLSSGLTYVPGVYTPYKSQELVELCKVVAEYDGIYVTHMRNEAADILAALEEAIYTAQEARVKLWVSHIKVMGVQNRDKVPAVLQLLQKAKEEGVEIYLDQYPYTSSSTVLMNVLPSEFRNLEALERLETDKAFRAQVQYRIENDDSENNPYINCGGWSGIVPVSLPETPDAQGISIEQYAISHNYENHTDAFFDIIIKNKMVGFAMYFSMNDEDIQTFAGLDQVVIGSDGVWHSDEELAHPRTFGTFPRAIALFVKGKDDYQKAFTIEEMVYKMTGKTAAYAGLKRKGILREGYDADLVLFNLSTISDPEGFIAAYRQNIGIEQVYVGGRLAYAADDQLYATTGTVIAMR